MLEPHSAFAQLSHWPSLLFIPSVFLPWAFVSLMSTQKLSSLGPFLSKSPFKWPVMPEASPLQ